MSIEIIDNYLSQEDHNKIIGTFLRANAIPWLLSDIVQEDKWNVKLDKKYNYQFCYILYLNHVYNQHIDLIEPILKKLNPLALIRIKTNLNPWAKEIVEHCMHIDDFSPKAKSAIYYVNTNNGYTVFDTGEKVKSVANRLVIFDSNRLHTGTTCTDEMFRCVINFVYVPR